MNVSDFYSTLKTHNDDHKKFFGLTTYQDSFYGTKKSASKTINTQLYAKNERKRRNQRQIPAGKSSKTQGI